MVANPASRVYSCACGLPFFGSDAYFCRTASATAAWRDDPPPLGAIDTESSKSTVPVFFACMSIHSDISGVIREIPT